MKIVHTELTFIVSVDISVPIKCFHSLFQFNEFFELIFYSGKRTTVKLLYALLTMFQLYKQHFHASYCIILQGNVK